MKDMTLIKNVTVSFSMNITFVQPKALSIKSSGPERQTFAKAFQIAVFRCGPD